MRKAEFNYIDHYKKDAEEFDYFGERSGATAHDERRVREYIIHECDVKGAKYWMWAPEALGWRNISQKKALKWFHSIFR